MRFVWLLAFVILSVIGSAAYANSLGIAHTVATQLYEDACQSRYGRTLIKMQEPGKSAYLHVRQDDVCVSREKFTAFLKGLCDRGDYFVTMVNGTAYHNDQLCSFLPKSGQPSPGQTSVADQEQKDPCQQPGSWSIDCGFVPPDKVKGLSPQEKFKFQEQQRDQLMQAMVMSSQQASQTAEVQKYMTWVADISVRISRNWEWNRVQNPDLDASSSNPSSSYGQRLLMERRFKQQKDVWEALKRWDAAIVMFSKESCDFCHEQMRILQYVNIATGLPVWSAPLEGSCLAWDKNNCVPLEIASKAAAEVFAVKVVPAVFLYLPESEAIGKPGGTWIRLANGFETAKTIEDRAYNFLLSWRLASMEGAKDAMDNPSPDIPVQVDDVNALINNAFSGEDKK